MNTQACAKKPRTSLGLMLRCGGAVTTGLLMVTVITLGLLVLGDADEPPVKSASYTIQFPEDEAMLKDLSRQLIRQAEAEQLQTLTEIEPASGTVTAAEPEAHALVLPEQPK